MPASFDGNDGNDGNSANSGGGGNATSVSSGWFFADRVNLPLVTAPDRKPLTATPDVMIGRLPAIKIKNFPDLNWSAEWYAWRALNEFAGTAWNTINPATNALTSALWPAWIPGPPTPPATVDWSAATVLSHAQEEIEHLVRAAMNERADALAEILSQSDEFISYFLNMMTARPGAYPNTTKVSPSPVSSELSLRCTSRRCTGARDRRSCVRRCFPRSRCRGTRPSRVAIRRRRT